MIPYLYNHWYTRLIAGSLAGLFVLLITEILLNIKYRYFDLFQTPVSYLYAGILGIILFENLNRLGKYLDKNQSWQSGPGRRLFLQSMLGILTAAFWITLIRLLISLIFFPEKLIILEDEVLILVLVILFIISLNLADYAFFLNERYRNSLAELERFRKESAEYQFEMLKLQLNPHFLFNSLNTLSSLVYEDASNAAEFIRRLSEVYRYVLENRTKELVTLEEEMEFIRAFTFLQGLRFQDMINFNYQVTEASLFGKIAPMTLQLLVENAIKHNVASRKQPLDISIVSDNTSIYVLNNFQPKPEQSGTGVGLKNIISRYEFLTNRKVEIIKDDRSFKVIIPLI